MILRILTALIISCSVAMAGQGMGPGPGVKGYAASSYSDITFYANTDTLGTAPQKGSGTMTITAGILLNTATPILGAGSWDNNNDNYDAVIVPIAGGNLDWNDGRIGFYLRPFENGSGTFAMSGGATPDASDMQLAYYSATEFKLRYKDRTAFLTHGISTFDGSVTYYIEIQMTGTAATVYINGSSIGGVTGATGTITEDLRIGTYDTQMDSHYDQIIISNDTDRDINAIRDITSF